MLLVFPVQIWYDEKCHCPGNGNAPCRRQPTEVSELSWANANNIKAVDWLTASRALWWNISMLRCNLLLLAWSWQNGGNQLTTKSCFMHEFCFKSACGVITRSKKSIGVTVSKFIMHFEEQVSQKNICHMENFIVKTVDSHCLHIQSVFMPVIVKSIKAYLIGQTYPLNDHYWPLGIPVMSAIVFFRTTQMISMPLNR